MAAIDRLRFRQREKRSEQLVNRHRVTYQQQAYEDTFVTSFLQRPDVAPALPYFSRRRKISLEREAVMARDGNSHSYLMLRQGKKRFLFAEEEIPINVTSDEERAKQLSFTLAVPQQIMRDEDLLPQAGHVFKRFRNRREVRRTLRTIGKNAYWMMRGNPEDPRSLENNTDFIQSIPSLVVHDHQPNGDNIRFSVRGKAHDKRLGGMLIPLFASGHSDPGDFFRRFKVFQRYGLQYALIRETAEETAMQQRVKPDQKPSKPFHIFPERGEHDFAVTPLGVLKLLWYYRISPLGIIYMENQPVDKVHAGIIYEATPRRRNKHVEFTLNGKSKETTKVISLSPTQYRQAITVGIQEADSPQPTIFEPASWTNPLVDAIEERSLRKPSPLRRAILRA